MFQALPIMENDWKPVNCVKEKELEEEEKLDLTFKIYYIYYLVSLDCIKMIMHKSYRRFM